VSIGAQFHSEEIKKARSIARKKKISLNIIVDPKLKEFVSAYQKKETALAGLDAFFRKGQDRVGHVTWRREEQRREK
jgi:hypothetical protein